ncbi:MAG: ABC transporter permease [Tyzzerella sp.]|nr:ABC transporter permease [Tyzzerella sp.]
MHEASKTQISAEQIAVEGVSTKQISARQSQFLKELKKHRLFVQSARVILLVGFLLLWEVTSYFDIIDSFIFSSPSKVALCFWSMVLDKSIFTHIGTTLYETIVSFLLVTVISILLATILWFSKKSSEISEPFLVVLNSLPKSALAPLLIVWLGATPTTIIVAGMSVAIFGSILNLYTSFMSVEEETLKLIYTLGGKRRHALIKVVIPSSVPAIISNMKVNIGLCLVGVVIGEFLAARNGLGYLIIYSSQVFKMDWLLMSIVILCIIAIALYGIIGIVEKWYLKRL